MRLKVINLRDEHDVKLTAFADDNDHFFERRPVC